MVKEIAVCQAYKKIFRGTYCEKHPKRDCKFLQSFLESDLDKLLEKDYQWFNS